MCSRKFMKMIRMKVKMIAYDRTQVLRMLKESSRVKFDHDNRKIVNWNEKLQMLPTISSRYATSRNTVLMQWVNNEHIFRSEARRHGL